MYHHFYGLRETPFAVTPDPRYLFLSDCHREALASITYCVQERKGFVMIVGEVGTGKTTVVRHVLERFGPEVRSVFIFQPTVSFEELLQVILREAEVPCPSRRRVDMVEALNQYLLRETAAGRYVVLIIDEAQHLSSTVLEELRLLSNLETARSKLIQIVLVGQPELARKLARPGLRQLRQRVVLVASLRPLTYRETVQYVAHRLQVAGHRGGRLFTRPALRRVYKGSGGIPRLINVICDKALLLGYGADARRITRRLIVEATKDRQAFEQGRFGTGLRAPAAAVAPKAEGRKLGRASVLVTAAGVGAAAALVVAVGGTERVGRLADVARGFLSPESAVPAARPQPQVDRPPREAAAPGVPSGPDAVRLAGGSPVGGREDDGRPEVPEEAQSARARPDVRAPAGEVAPAPATDAGGPPVPQETHRAGPSEDRTSGDVLSYGAATPSDQPKPASGRRIAEALVGPGDTLSALVRAVYGRVDYTLLDVVKEANPHVANIDVIEAGQRLRFPQVDVAAMVRRWGDRYVAHVATVPDSRLAAAHSLAVSLAAGLTVRSVPIPLTQEREGWYRILVGDFASRDQAEAFYRTAAARFEPYAALWR